MSGAIGDNPYRASGVVAQTVGGGGVSWQAVTTASTLTVEAGKGYPINTTSNACTVTLPSSASVGDEIILTDYARTWATNNLTISSSLLFRATNEIFAPQVASFIAIASPIPLEAPVMIAIFPDRLQHCISV